MTSTLPLAGVRVADFSSLMPAGLATLKLADLGADVVKIENDVVGDRLRIVPPMHAGEGLQYKIFNRGKRSVALNLRQEEGRTVARNLALAADVVVESSRPGRSLLGMPLAELRTTSPRLVICSITGFGQTGPWRSLPAHGMNIDAAAGHVPIRWIDGRPRLDKTTFVGMGTELGGMNAALAIVAAVMRAKMTGEGAVLDISCWDAALEAHRVSIAHLLMLGERETSLSDLGPLYDVYPTAESGLVMFCAIEKKFWERFCNGVDRADLVERWSGTDDAGMSFETDEALAQELQTIFLTASAAQWMERFILWDIPGSPVLGVEEIIESPQFSARDILGTPYPDGTVRLLDAARFDENGSRPGEESSAAPALGADNGEVLAEWLGATG